MAKFWIQYDAASGTYVPWDANTPPSPESVHRARFLSQFPAWIKYLSAMEGTDPALWFPCGNGSCATDHSFIYPASGTGEDRHIGTIIQTASFWNMLNWKPSEKWINVAEEELVVDAVLEDPTKPLVETDAYAEAETADIYAGEVIHPGHAESQILEWLWNLRKRIDLCVAVPCEIVSSEYRFRSYFYSELDPENNYDIDEIRSGIFSVVSPYGPKRFTCGSIYSQYQRGLAHGWAFSEARNITARPLDGMPELSTGSLVLHYTENPSWAPLPDFVGFPYVETGNTSRRVVDAFTLEPTPIFGTVLIENGKEQEGIYVADVVTHANMQRDGYAVSLETPHADYLPSNSLFNDSCPFQKLYTA